MGQSNILILIKVKAYQNHIAIMNSHASNNRTLTNTREKPVINGRDIMKTPLTQDGLSQKMTEKERL